MQIFVDIMVKDGIMNLEIGTWEDIKKNMKKNKKKKRKIVGYYYNGYTDTFEVLYDDES
jgi:hypothetical protein